VEQIYFPLFARWSFMIEIVCVAAFSLELILRIISAPSFLLIHSDLFCLLDFVRKIVRRYPSPTVFLSSDRHFVQCDEFDRLSSTEYASDHELSFHLLLVVDLEIIPTLSAGSPPVTSTITLSSDEHVSE
jgi:hypothetical protein